jgi:RimJ/RimL family protein N-acetyltransferase
MQLTSRGITLRQVTEDDLPFLFGLFVDPCRSHLWMCGRTVHDERSFHEAWIGWSTGMMGAKYLVEAANRPIGLVFDYDRTIIDGFTKVTALLNEESVGLGGGVVATGLLVDWLFQHLPLRKVYMEVYSYNRPVVRMLRKAGLLEEGQLRGARFWNEEYWDVHIFAVERRGWPDVRRRFLRQRTEARTTRAPRNGRVIRAVSQAAAITPHGIPEPEARLAGACT